MSSNIDVDHGKPSGVAGSAFADSLRNFVVNTYELPQSNRIASMEGVRGLAILLVFFVHYHSAFSHYLDLDSLSFSISYFSWSIGPSGVDLFFALSGYLVYGIVIQRGGNYLRFMLRRAERIYPTFLFVLALYIALSLISPRQGKLPTDAVVAIKYILENAALLPGVFNIDPIITVAWSLSFEWFFYASVPVLVSILRMKRWRLTTRVIFITIFSGAFIIYGVGRRVPLIHFSMFASGMLLYELSNSSWFKSKLCRVGEVIAILMFIVTFPLIYFIQTQQRGPDPNTVLWDGSVIGVLYLSFFWFLVYAINYDGILKRALSWTPLRWMGNISYSYYLLHGLVLNTIAVLLRSSPQIPQHGAKIFWIGLPLAFLLTVVASTVIFVLIERPFSLRKKSDTTSRRLAFSASS